MGYNREEAWLCDLLPYSRINPNQQNALETHYNPLVKDFDLPMCTIPKFIPAELNKPSRVDEIVAELEQSQADTILLLGDLPIKHFLSYFSKFKKLSDFKTNQNKYGNQHPTIIGGKTYNVIPLVHPSQAGNLGRSGYSGDADPLLRSY